MTTAVDTPKQDTPPQRAVTALLKLLEHPDPEIRLRAAELIFDARRDGLA